MKKTVYVIDIGSSTTKVYKSENHFLRLITTKSIPIKKGVRNSFRDLSDQIHEVIQLINTVKEKEENPQIRIIATAVFRELNVETLVKIKDLVFSQTGVYFNVISHDLENFYLEKALAGKFDLKESLLLINIGGGSTELVIIKDGKAVERINFKLGVGSIMDEFPEINNGKTNLDLVIDWLMDQLPAIKSKVNRAIYSGGELNYMRLTGYELDHNDIFVDSDHPSKVTFLNFEKKNREIFEKLKVSDLQKLMPEDPNWMLGARSCSALAQAICMKYSINEIVPSDSNTAHGYLRQEMRSVALSGSFRKHLSYIAEIKDKLKGLEVAVLSPRFTKPKNPGAEFVVFDGEEGMSPLELERHHLEAIDKSDALIVCNPNGYVGASTMIEIGYADRLGKRIIFTENPEEFMLNTLPCEIGLNF